MSKTLKIVDTLIPVSVIVWCEKVNNTTLAVYTTRSGDAGVGYDIATITHTTDSTQATLNAFNAALELASKPSSNGRPIIDITSQLAATAVAIA